MDNPSASDNDLWPGPGVLSCAVAILFAGYAASVLLLTAVDVPKTARAPETGTIEHR